jgi:hypothetical protein
MLHGAAKSLADLGCHLLVPPVLRDAARWLARAGAHTEAGACLQQARNLLLGFGCHPALAASSGKPSRRTRMRPTRSTSPAPRRMPIAAFVRLKPGV